jgi:preprotein translocase subunit SecG
MTEQIILIAHLLIALAIIGLIMLQQGKGADMGASFGAGASQTLFGSGGSGNVLTKATTLLVVAFFVTSFGLAIVARDKAVVVDDVDLAIPGIETTTLAEEFAEDLDLPRVEEDVPAAMVVGEGVEDDIPDLE